MTGTPAPVHDLRSATHGDHDRQLTLGDGRRLGYLDLGPAGGAPVVYCHGFPASRVEVRFAEPALATIGARMIAIDRPGYGRSDFLPGRRIADWARDVEEIADRLRLGRFALLGVSGGGPYALACAAALPDRVTSAAIVGGLGRLDAREDRARMNRFARFSIALARRAPALSRIFNCVLAPGLRGSPRLMLKLLASGMPAADRDVLADDRVFAVFTESLREAFVQGGRGAAHDLTLYARPWGIALEAMRVPCRVWHGEQDTTVPVEMGKLLAAAIPGCQSTILPSEGHFSLPVRHMRRILSALIEGG